MFPFQCEEQHIKGHQVPSDRVYLLEGRNILQAQDWTDLGALNGLSVNGQVSRSGHPHQLPRGPLLCHGVRGGPDRGSYQGLVSR